MQADTPGPAHRTLPLGEVDPRPAMWPPSSPPIWRCVMLTDGQWIAAAQTARGLGRDSPQMTSPPDADHDRDVAELIDRTAEAADA